LGFDDNGLYTSSHDRLGRLFDLRSGNLMSTFAGHTQHLKNIMLGKPGEVITSGTTEIKVYDTRNDGVLRAFNTVANIKCITYAGNNRVIAGLQNGALMIYNTINGNLEYSGNIHNGSINCLHTDGEVVVTGSDDTTLKLFDINSHAVLFHLQDHQAAVNSVQLDDRKIVSGGADMCMKVWDRKTGDRLYSLLGGSLQQRGNNNPHPQKVGCSQLMFDSSRVVGSYNSLLRIYTFLLTE